VSEDLFRELASVQLELESARGARAVELWEVERRLLVEHKNELFGPLAKVAFQFGWDTVLWRRGHMMVPETLP